MTTRRRGRARTFGRALRRISVWYDRIVNLSLAAAGDQESVDLTSAIPNTDRKGMTVVRILIDLSANLTIAGTGANVGMGITLVESDAAAVVQFPDPSVEGDQPGWLWRVQRPVFTASPNDPSQSTRFVHDIKARRRLPGEDYLLMLVVDSSAGNAIINVDGIIRTLWLRT